jgi:hypothetical protein
MSATVRVAIEDPATAIPTYTSIRLYRDTDPGGDFSSVLSTTALVAATYEYLITDSTGSSTSWYRFDLYHSTDLTTSEQSPPFQAGVSMSWLRIEAAIRAMAGFKSTATSGSLTTLVDSVLRDNGVDTAFLSGAWVYRPNASAANKLRRIGQTGFTVASGTLTPIRDWTVSPSAAEEYHIFTMAPPTRQAGTSYSWDDAIRTGLERVRFVDLLVLGVGDGAERRFSLDTHSNQVGERHIQRVWIRTTDSDGHVTECDAGKMGRTWHVIENTPDSLTLELIPAPTASETVVVEALCKDAALYRDDDTTLVPPERAVRATVYEFFKAMNRREPGRYAAELSAAAQEYDEREAEESPAMVVRLV